MAVFKLYIYISIYSVAEMSDIEGAFPPDLPSDIRLKLLRTYEIETKKYSCRNIVYANLVNYYFKVSRCTLDR